MIYPEDWKYYVSDEGATVDFVSPDEMVILNLGLTFYEQEMNLRTFTSTLIEMFPKDEGIELSILNEEIKTIHNFEWLIVDRIVKNHNEQQNLFFHLGFRG